MRRIILTAVGLACLAGISWFVGSVSAQNAPKPDVPHKVGLIDMGEVFNKYDKLSELRTDFTAEQQSAEEQAKKHVADIQKIQKEMQGLNEGSPDFTKREQQLAKLVSEFETFKKLTQKDLMKKEAKMYHTVYLEVQDAVAELCRYHGYTVVLRFSREELNSNDPPQKLLQGMNRQVVHNRKKDDMTNAVITMLNQNFGKGVPAANEKKPAKAVKQVNGARGDTVDQ